MSVRISPSPPIKKSPGSLEFPGFFLYINALRRFLKAAKEGERRREKAKDSSKFPVKNRPLFGAAKDNKENDVINQAAHVLTSLYIPGFRCSGASARGSRQGSRGGWGYTASCRRGKYRPPGTRPYNRSET